MSDTIQLTNEERLQLQNFELKRRLILTEGSLNEARAREVTGSIGERLGVNLMQYILDIETGKGELIKRVRSVPDESEEVAG